MRPFLIEHVLRPAAFVTERMLVVGMMAATIRDRAVRTCSMRKAHLQDEEVISSLAAYVITDILEGNTTPSVNPVWAEHIGTTPNGQRRPAAFKTGTTNDAKDLNA